MRFTSCSLSTVGVASSVISPSSRDAVQRTADRLARMKRCAAAVLLLVLAGCGGSSGSNATTTRAAPTPATGAVPWPAPPNPMALTRKAGLTPETHEFVFLHVHSRLFVFVNGEPVTVPAGIGIDINNQYVHRGKLEDGKCALRGLYYHGANR